MNVDPRVVANGRCISAWGVCAMEIVALIWNGLLACVALVFVALRWSGETLQAVFDDMQKSGEDEVTKPE